MGLPPGGNLSCVLLNSPDDIFSDPFRRGAITPIRQTRDQPLHAELLLQRVGLLVNSVGAEDNDVARVVSICS